MPERNSDHPHFHSCRHDDLWPVSPYPNALLFAQLLPTSAAAFHTHKRRPHGHWESRILSGIRECNPCALWMHGWRVHTLHPKPRFFRAHAQDHAHASRCVSLFLSRESGGFADAPSLLWLRGVMKPGRLRMLVDKKRELRQRRYHRSFELTFVCSATSTKQTSHYAGSGELIIAPVCVALRTCEHPTISSGNLMGAPRPSVRTSGHA